MKCYLIFAIVCCFAARLNGSSMGGLGFFGLQKAIGPFPAIIAVGVGKASLAGTRKYCETENISEAAGTAIESCVNSTAAVLQTAAGLTAAGAGLLKDIYDGKIIRDSILSRTKQALDFIPGGQVLKVAIDFGDGYNQGLNTKEIIVKKAKNSVEGVPGGKALQVGIDISSDYYLKGETPRDIIIKKNDDAKSSFS